MIAIASPADISTLFLNETREPDLLERATNVSALPQNWKVQLRLRAKSGVFISA